MNKQDAEEYTESLGQIFEGSWRQIWWSEKQGIPKLCGYNSTAEWAQAKLGGYRQKLTPEERLVAIAEIKADDPEASTRKIAGVLGVDQKTVVNDLRAEENSSPGESETKPDTDTEKITEENSSHNPIAAKRKAGEDRPCPRAGRRQRLSPLGAPF